MKKDIKIKDLIIKYASIVCGVSMVAFAVAVFYTPNKIVSGGVSGISTILYHTLHISQGVSFFTINTLLLLISLKPLGKGFVFNTIWVSTLLSVLVEAFSYIPPLTDDIFLATVFGSILYGAGIGLTLINGASTGGTDVLARLVQKAFSHVKIGSLLLFVDLSVILSSLIVFKKINLSLYGIVALCICSFSINFLIRKLNISKLAFIITTRGEELAAYLIKKSPRGVTLINSKGGYTMKNNSVLLCALKEQETVVFQKRVLKVDPDAFIIFSESSQIIGNGFRVYK
ncbi:MAG: YitT family protein [Clostridia bacterium]|nr:YitT family protein [Clostridia bacterium]